MNNHHTNFSTFNSPEPPKVTLNLRSLLNRYVFHWPLFIVFLTLALALGLLYTKFAKPVYEVKATLLIKDEKKAPDAQSALHEIELLGTSKTVENEIEVLKSNQLIAKIVSDLNLNISYQIKENFLYKDLYKSTPVILTLIKLNPGQEKKELNIIIKDDKKFIIKDENERETAFYFNKSYTDENGTWSIKPTNELSKFKDASIKIRMYSVDDLALKYQKLININLINKLGTTVLLTVNDQIPQRGKDILNQLIYNYNFAAIAEKNKETKNTLDFLNQKLDSLSGELSNAEKGIEGFKSSRGLTDISMQSQVSLQNLQTNDIKLNEINLQLNNINTIDRYINSAQNLGKVPSVNGISDPNLTSSVDRLSQLQLQYEQLAANTPETSPEFEQINRQIKTTKQAIKESVRNIKISLQGTRDKLQSYNSNFESSIRNIPSQERQYINIKRQQSSKEGLYTYYLQKREELAANYAGTLKNDHVVDQAFVGTLKSPSRSLVFAVALMLGGLFPIGIIYTRNSLKNSVIDIEDIKKNINVPILAELILEPSQELINVNGTQQNLISEQFRALRIKLYHLYGESRAGRVTLLTSSISGEGKSYVSSNLAMALSSIERKTIVLEMDLRKPQISQIFNLPTEHQGITDYLNGQATLTEVTQPSNVSPNLFIISAGPISNQSSELLEKKQLKELISTLRESYDDIIIDSPPVHLVPDAMIISKYADVTLYVVRQGYTNKNELGFLKELNHNTQLSSNVNIVFNGIKRNEFGYGYKYDTSYYNQTKKPSFLSSIFSDFSARF